MATETNTAGRRIAGTRRPRLSLARGRSLRGIGYATPTAVIVAVFFLVPLVLVFWMSVNRWPLLGTPTFNAPDNYTEIPDNQLFVDAVWFTLKYTVITTVVLSARRDGPRADGAGPPPRRRALPDRVLPARARSGSPPRRCCSTASTARSARSTRCCRTSGSSTSR